MALKLHTLGTGRNLVSASNNQTLIKKIYGSCSVPFLSTVIESHSTVLTWSISIG